LAVERSDGDGFESGRRCICEQAAALVEIEPNPAVQTQSPIRGRPSTYAKFVVDTVTSLGQRAEQSFFKNQAQTHIGLALELLTRLGMESTLPNIRAFLLEDSTMSQVLGEMKTDYPTDRDNALIKHFSERYRGQPAEQMGGVKETIANYLQFFLTPDVVEVFSDSKNSFDFKEIDRGKIICVAMPQKFQMERRYINTFLKMLFYTHVLRRFDRPKEERATDNLLILWADEAQRFVTASEDGMSDYNCIDVMRETTFPILFWHVPAATNTRSGK
jgi:type IV secretory pathway TraG/TraD family ATPase VirD4